MNSPIISSGALACVYGVVFRCGGRLSTHCQLIIRGQSKNCMPQAAILWEHIRVSTTSNDTIKVFALCYFSTDISRYLSRSFLFSWHFLVCQRGMRRRKEAAMQLWSCSGRTHSVICLLKQWRTLQEMQLWCLCVMR